MVIGNGLLAKRFSSYQENRDVVIFASGVSDSKLEDDSAYNREVALLDEMLKANEGRLFVYFSTCSISDPSLATTAYIKHKERIEVYLQQKASCFLIFRLSNLAGKGGNSKTILNYLVNAIRQHVYFDLWENAYRNILDVDDAFMLMDAFIGEGRTNEIINIANPFSYNTREIVAEIETFTGTKANYSLVDKGEFFKIDTLDVEAMAARIGINFDQAYLSSILRKYYS